MYVLTSLSSALDGTCALQTMMGVALSCLRSCLTIRQSPTSTTSGWCSPIAASVAALPCAVTTGTPLPASASESSRHSGTSSSTKTIGLTAPLYLHFRIGWDQANTLWLRNFYEA